MRAGMTLWYLSPQGAQTKLIDFASRTDIVSASCMAYLNYSAMKAAATASRMYHSHLYVALTGFRYYELPENLCWGCGWVTGRRHIGLTCNMENYCCTDADALFCMRCMRVDGTKVYCIRCPDDAPRPNSLAYNAWSFSCHLNDAITKRGYWHKSRARPPEYPYQIACISGEVLVATADASLMTASR